jgi:hypothetical protein
MARKARFTARLNVPIQASLREALDDLADRNDRLVSDEVRAAITYHLRMNRTLTSSSPRSASLWTASWQ